MFQEQHQHVNVRHAVFFLSRKKDAQTVGRGKLDLPLLGNDLLFFFFAYSLSGFIKKTHKAQNRCASLPPPVIHTLMITCFDPDRDSLFNLKMSSRPGL